MKSTEWSILDEDFRQDITIKRICTGWKTDNKGFNFHGKNISFKSAST
jgi:hypothetical protein